jgi:hypothetical protein
LNILVGELVNGPLVLDSSVRYFDRPWIRGILFNFKIRKKNFKMKLLHDYQTSVTVEQLYILE